jgi:hypothetical protein
MIVPGSLIGWFWQDTMLVWAAFWVPTLWGLQHGLSRRL